MSEITWVNVLDVSRTLVAYSMAVYAIWLIRKHEHRCSAQASIPVIPNAPTVDGKAKPLQEAQFRGWCVDGYALAETSSLRSQRENKTKPTSHDKRECAVAWVQSQCKAAGISWSPDLAAKAAQLIEIHHASANPEAVFKLVRK